MAAVPQSLRCEYLPNPIGIDVSKPRLSWIVAADRRGAAQSAYQVLAATSQAALDDDQGDLWDSGRIASDETLHIAYAGKPLRSEADVFWKVRVWDEQEKASGWSDVATWRMGLLDAADWKGSWIGKPQAPPADERLPSLPATMLRKQFTTKSGVRRAFLTATALGVYEFSINGRRVGEYILSPEWTNHHKQIQYHTYDVTELVASGENAIVAMLGDGWYAGRLGISHIVENGPLRGHYGKHPHLRAQLAIEYNDGSRDIVATDASWKCTTDGPIRKSCILDGEVYDAQKLPKGWDTASFDDAGWDKVHVLKQVAGQLVAQMNEPIRVTEEIKPIARTEPSPGVYVFDFGQNLAGWCRLRVKGPAGTTIRLRHAEVLEEDGNIYRDNLRMKPLGGEFGARQEDEFTLRGEGEEVFEPHFTYHGYRYVEVTGWPGEPSTDAIVSRVFHSDCPTVGQFTCSSPMLTQLMKNIVWTHRDNMHSIPTDCPQRDERLGWMGDMLVFAQTAAFNMDMAAFFTKWMRDIRNDQAKDGRYPDVAPHPYDPDARFSGVASWGDAGVIVPWRTYVNYGDTRILRDSLDSMKRWVDWIHANNADLLWKNNRNNDYGDWLNGDTFKLEGYGFPKGAEMPKEVLATAFWQHSAALVSKMAAIIGEKNDAAKYGKLADDIKTAFVNAYIDDDAKVQGHTQAGYALALDFDLVPPDKTKAAADHMVERIANYKNHISTGFQTTVKLMNELSRNGRSDVAYKLVNNRTIPSWGYTIDHGGTTIWERWDGYVEGRGFQDPGMNSFNHYAIGAVGEWMYRWIVGIQPDESQPAYKHFTLRPQPGGGLKWAKGRYESIRGPIVSEWSIQQDGFEWVVKIPANTTATVYVPVQADGQVTESGKPADAAEGITQERREQDAVVYRVTSGSYTFRSEPFVVVE